MSEFGSTLKNLRIINELTQTELAEKLNVSKSAISMYENGKREPDFETLELIADYFNVNLSFLINSDQNKDFDAIAAHHAGENWTEEELKEIEWFKDLVKAKRNNK